MKTAKIYVVRLSQREVNLVIIALSMATKLLPGARVLAEKLLSQFVEQYKADK